MAHHECSPPSSSFNNYRDGPQYNAPGGTQNINKGSGNLLVHYINQGPDQCLRDLFVTDPRKDKKRIEDRKGGLLEESYGWILDHSEFQQFRDNPQSRLLWIRGGPGKGKTMLLCGMINKLMLSCSLLFFFCEARDARINNATAVVRGLIYFLVDEQPELLSYVKKKYDRAGERLYTDVNAWEALSEIFTNILQDQRLQTKYILIDALDECAKDDLPRLLKLIVELSSASHHVKWIVSSRDWPTIKNELTVAGCQNLEMNTNLVSHAVDIYINHKVSLLKHIQHDKELQGQVRQIMHEKANSTFLWVALVFDKLQRLGDTEYEDTSEILEILNIMPSDLTDLYKRMMEQIGLLEGKDPSRCQTILATVALVYKPLHLLELSALAGFKGNLTKRDPLERLVHKCGSFLAIQDGVIDFVHQSAKDYLVKDASTFLFPSGPDKVHDDIFSRSLELMNTTLRRDVYGLGSPGYPIDQVSVPNPDPLATVWYSCVYWVDHLCDSCSSADVGKDDLQDNGTVHTFLEKTYLYWLEALSLLRCVPEGVIAIKRLESLGHGKGRQLADLLRDARRFILSHKSIIENAPLQVYASALVFSPVRSKVRELFQAQEPRVTLKPIVEDWGALLQTLEGHSGPVKAVAFSPDGQLVASASDDGTVRLWDPVKGAAHGEALKGHSDWVNGVAFSPDGQLVASASNDRTIRLWDPVKGVAYGKVLKGHSDSVHAVIFSPNGQLVASASYDRTVRLWDPVKGAAHGKALKGHSDSVNAVAFSPDGQLVVSASNDRTVRLWDLVKGAAHGKALKGLSGQVWAVAFSPNGQLVASASDDCTVRLWDPVKGAAHGKALKGHSGTVWAVAFSPDSKLIASASDDHTVRLWDAATGTAHGEPLKGHSGSVYAVAFSPDGQLVASVSYDRTVRLWDPVKGAAHGEALKGHSGRVRAVTFSPDGQLVASASYDRTVRLWNPVKGVAHGEALKGHSDWVKAVVFSPNGQLVASASCDHTVRLWDPVKGAAHGEALKGHSGRVNAVAFSPNGQLVASASDDRTVRLWDPVKGVAHGEALKGHSGWVNAVVFSPNGQLVASASDDRTVRLWDPVKGVAHGKALKGHSGWVYAVAFSPKSQLVASASYDRTVRLWDPVKGMAYGEALKGHSGSVNAVAFSPDGQLVVSASNDRTVRLWDPVKGAALGELQTNVNVQELQFSTDGQAIDTDRGRLVIRTLSLNDTSVPSTPRKELFVDEEWIVQGTQRILWLPFDYRATCAAVHGRFLAMGHESGGVSMIEIERSSTSPLATS